MIKNKPLKIVLTIVIIILLVTFFENYGWIGIVLFILAFGIKRVYDNRKQIMLAIRTIEIMIFKKPLDKELWEKDELKKLKIKVVWRKNKMETENKIKFNDLSMPLKISFIGGWVSIVAFVIGFISGLFGV